MRRAVVRYFEEVAPDSEVRMEAFCKFGPHGSSSAGQASLRTAYNHLPLEDRLAVTKLIIHFYSLRSRQGRLLCPDSVPPDLHTLMQAIEAADSAVCNGVSHYTTVKEGADNGPAKKETL